MIAPGAVRLRPRKPRLPLILLVNLAILVSGVVLAELIFGGWIRPRALNRLQLVRSASLDIDVSKLYPRPTPTIRYTRDRHGLRGSFDEPSRIDLLTLGGSTTDQRYLADGETWQDALQARFEEDGRTIVVGNAGVDGQSTFGHIKAMDDWLPHVPGLRPWAVLFYVGINDFHKDAGYAMDRLRHSEADAGWLARIEEDSAVWHVARTLKGAYDAEFVYQLSHRARPPSSFSWTREPLIDGEDYDRLMSARLFAYRQRLSVLAERTLAIGAAPIFVAPPTRNYRHRDGAVEGIVERRDYDGRAYNGVDYYHMSRRLDAATMAVCREVRGTCIDLVAHGGWEDDDFYDLVHMTPRGARKVGGRLYAALREVHPRLDAGAAPY